MHCAQLQRLHQSLHRRRTSTLRRIATSRFISSNPPQRRRPICSRLPRKYGTRGVRGKIQFIFPRAAFGSFRRDERNNVTEPCSMKERTTPCSVEQFPAVSLSLSPSAKSSSLPEGAFVRSDAVVLYQSAHRNSFRHPPRRMPPIRNLNRRGCP